MTLQVRRNHWRVASMIRSVRNRLWHVLTTAVSIWLRGYYPHSGLVFCKTSTYAPRQRNDECRRVQEKRRRIFDFTVVRGRQRPASLAVAAAAAAAACLHSKAYFKVYLLLPDEQASLNDVDKKGAGQPRS